MKNTSNTGLEGLWSKEFKMICAANFLMSFSFYLLMPTLPIYLSKQLNLPDSQGGIILFSYMLAMLFARPFSGFLIDNFSRKKLFLISLILYGSFFSLYFVLVSFIGLILLRFAQGAAWGIASVGGSTISIDIIPSHLRGKGVGMYGFFMNVSMAIAPLIGLKIYINYGFNTLIASCLAAACCAVVFVSFIQIKERQKENEVVLKKTYSLDRFILVKALPISFNLMLCAIGYGMLVSYGAMYAQKTGIHHSELLFVFLAIGIGISRIISGYYVDKGYLHQISIASLVLLAIALPPFVLVHQDWAFSLFALLLGVGFGSMVPGFLLLFVNMAPHQQRGTANATYLTSFDLGIGLGMLIGGVFSQYFELYQAFLFGALCCALAVPYYIWISMPLYEKNKQVNDSI